MLLNKQQVIDLLTCGQRQASEDFSSIHYDKQSNGGQLSKWRWLRGEQHVWQQQEERSPATLPKLLICNPFLRDCEIDSLELSFLSSLIKHTSVFLWTKECSELSDCIQLTDSSEFWEKRAAIYPATQEKIQDALTIQGVNINDFLILDYNNYEMLFNRYIKTVNENKNHKEIPRPLFHLDVSKLSLHDEDSISFLLKGVHVNQIKSVRVIAPTEEDRKFLFQCFPHLERVEILNTDELWLEQHLKKYACLKGIKIENTSSTCIQVPAVREFSLDRAALKKLTFDNEKCLEKLEIGSRVKLSDSCLGCLPPFPSLKAVKWETQDIFFNIFAFSPKLESIHIDSSVALIGNFSNSKHFKGTVPLDNVEKFPKSLVSLSIALERSDKVYDFSSWNLLTEVELFDGAACAFRLPDSVTSLKILGAHKEEFDFSYLKQLHTLNISYCFSTKKIIIPSSVRKLNISNCNELKAVENIGKLKIVNLYQLPKLQSFLFSESLQSISMLECNNLQVDSAKLQQLNYLNCEVENLKPAVLPELLELVFSQKNFLLGSPWNVDFNLYPKLEKIRINNNRHFKFTSIDLNKIKQLSLREINSSIIEYLKCFIRLETLDINSFSYELSNALRLKQKIKWGSNNFSIRELRIAFFNDVLINCFPKIEQLYIVDSVVILDLEHSVLNMDNLRWLKYLTILGHNQKITIVASDHSAIKAIELKESKKAVVFLENCSNLLDVKLASKKIEGKIKNCHLLECQRVVQVIPAERKLYYKNFPVSLIKLVQKSSVSIFNNKGKEIFIDTKTDAPKGDYQAIGDLKIEIISKKNIDKDFYRIHVWNNFKINATGQLVVGVKDSHPENVDISPTPFDEKKIAEWKHQAMQDVDVELGCLEFMGKVTPNTPYPLPLNEAAESKEEFKGYSCEPLVPIRIIRSPERQHFEFIALSDQPFKIFYFVKHAKKNFQCYFIVYTNPNMTTLLDESLREYLADKIKNHKDLGKLLKNDLTTDEKIKFIENYCKQFQVDKEQKSNASFYSMDEILYAIENQKGVCRHRAVTMTLLGRLCGVPILLITNEDHAYVAIPYGENENALSFTRCDLGGFYRLDATPANLRVGALSAIISKEDIKKDNPSVVSPKPSSLLPSTASINLNHHEADIAEDKKAFLQSYHQQFDAALNVKVLNSVEPLINDVFIFPPLLQLSASVSPWEVNAAIIQQLKMKNKDPKKCHLYIDRPDDFLTYLSHFYIEHGQRKKQSVSYLESLLKNGGILVINWNQFNSRQMMSYKSLLDSDPTFLDYVVSRNLRVISLIRENVIKNDVFLSRCTLFQLSANAIWPTHVPREDKFSYEINLNHRTGDAWLDTLFGKIEITAQDISLQDKESPLFQAIQANAPLLIINPPKNMQDFDEMILRINQERKFFYNGSYVDLPDRFYIHTKEQPLDKTLPHNVQVYEVENKEDIRQRIYLSLSNLYECMDLLSIQNNLQAMSNAGWLESYDAQREIFYLIGFIPQGEWQHLMDFIEKSYPYKTFHFLLAPGSEIENVKKRFQPEVLESKQIYVTNDTDYLSRKLAKDEKATIIDLTPETTFADLIACIAVKESADTSKLTFSYEEKEMLLALKQGKNIILNGMLSFSLYQQLLPLLSANNKLYLYGKSIAIQGVLYAVMPIQAVNRLSLGQYKKCLYDFVDYETLFNHPADKKHLNQLKKFYHGAKKLTFSNIGEPPLPDISFALLDKMVLALKSKKWHSQNPIKGLFHYDYPKNSEKYAYLNVLAKCIFQSDQVKPLRREKINNLLSKYHIDLRHFSSAKEHIWKLLNCLSWHDLKNVVGDLFNQANIAVDASGFPVFSPEMLEKLRQQLCAYQMNEPVKKSKTEKQLAELNVLLADESAFFIFIKGLPGVGKTYAIRELLKEKPYEGKKAIVKWLTAKEENKLHILLLDEANMDNPGTWDFLKGLSRHDKKVYYQGKEYALTGQHKVILTGNPESYPQRFFHNFIQHYANTLYFGKPEKEQETEFIKKILKTLASDHNVNFLLNAYHLIQRYNPLLVFSFRDLENLAYRFLYLNSKEDQQALAHACIGEFAGGIKDPVQRRAFIKELDPLYEQTKLELVDVSDIAYRIAKNM